MGKGDTDRRIQKAIDAGQKNLRTKELIANWCSHARVVKFGGTGLVEMQTGLPIGHHFMECDYAEAGGVAAWDLASTALDFHDRNCATCKHRSPVRLPNLSELVQARDEAERRRHTREKSLQQEAEEAHARRQGRRDTLRANLDALAATVVDHISELDRKRSAEAAEALLSTAKLAPEVFVPALIEHLFSLLETRERWFDDVGLKLLSELKADRTRLVRCALVCLGEHSSIRYAGKLVEENPAAADVHLIDNAVPPLVHLADPPHSPFSNHVHADPGPLQALYRSHPQAVEASIEKRFGAEDVEAIRTASRAIAVLAANDPTIAVRFARWTAAKLARADRLKGVEAFTDHIDDVVRDLQKALAAAISAAPDEVDELILRFAEGARGEGQAELYGAYAEVLRVGWREDPDFKLGREHTVALKRLISAASTSRSSEVLQKIQEAFSVWPRELTSVVMKELEHLLGAALLLDDELDRDDTPSAPDIDPLASLERMGRRNTLFSLQSSFIKWAAEAASGDAAACQRYIDVLERVPAERERVRAALLDGAAPLMERPDGLAVVLPSLYSAMVGASTRMRAAGATLLKEMDSRRLADVPELVLEALVMQLTDPYVVVHQAAVAALDTVRLPDHLLARTRMAVWMLVLVYARENDRKNDEFLIQCIEAVMGYASGEELRGKLGRYLIALLRKMDARVVSRNLYGIRSSLQTHDDYAKLLLDLVSNPHMREYEDERIFAAINRLPATMIFQNRTGFEAAGKAADKRDYLPFIEVLTRAGAWQEAVNVAEAAYSKVPRTNWSRPILLATRLEQIATQFELAIALGRVEEIGALAQQWRAGLKDIEDDNEKNEERRNPLRGILRSS